MYNKSIFLKLGEDCHPEPRVIKQEIAEQRVEKKPEVISNKAVTFSLHDFVKVFAADCHLLSIERFTQETVHPTVKRQKLWDEKEDSDETENESSEESSEEDVESDSASQLENEDDVSSLTNSNEDDVESQKNRRNVDSIVDSDLECASESGHDIIDDNYHEDTSNSDSSCDDEDAPECCDIETSSEQDSVEGSESDSDSGSDSNSDDDSESESQCKVETFRHFERYARGEENRHESMYDTNGICFQIPSLKCHCCSLPFQDTKLLAKHLTNRMWSRSEHSEAYALHVTEKVQAAKQEQLERSIISRIFENADAALKCPLSSRLAEYLGLVDLKIYLDESPMISDYKSTGSFMKIPLNIENTSYDLFFSLTWVESSNVKKKKLKNWEPYQDDIEMNVARSNYVQDSQDADSREECSDEEDNESVDDIEVSDVDSVADSEQCDDEDDSIEMESEEEKKCELGSLMELEEIVCEQEYIEVEEDEECENEEEVTDDEVNIYKEYVADYETEEEDEIEEYEEVELEEEEEEDGKVSYEFESAEEDGVTVEEKLINCKSEKLFRKKYNSLPLEFEYSLEDKCVSKEDFMDAKNDEESHLTVVNQELLSGYEQDFVGFGVGVEHEKHIFETLVKLTTNETTVDFEDLLEEEIIAEVAGVFDGIEILFEDGEDKKVEEVEEENEEKNELHSVEVTETVDPIQQENISIKEELPEQNIKSEEEAIKQEVSVEEAVKMEDLVEQIVKLEDLVKNEEMEAMEEEIANVTLEYPEREIKQELSLSPQGFEPLIKKEENNPDYASRVKKEELFSEPISHYLILEKNVKKEEEEEEKMELC